MPSRRRLPVGRDVERINEIANGLAAASLALEVGDDEAARRAVNETLANASSYLSKAVAEAGERDRRRRSRRNGVTMTLAAAAAAGVVVTAPGVTLTEQNRTDPEITASGGSVDPLPPLAADLVTESLLGDHTSAHRGREAAPTFVSETVSSRPMTTPGAAGTPPAPRTSGPNPSGPSSAPEAGTPTIEAGHSPAPPSPDHGRGEARGHTAREGAQKGGSGRAERSEPARGQADSAGSGQGSGGGRSRA